MKKVKFTPFQKTFFKPPRAIFDILHKAEVKGIKIPSIIDKWWEKETLKQEEIRTGISK